MSCQRTARITCFLTLSVLGIFASTARANDMIAAGFDLLDKAIGHFKSLLADAARTEADYTPEALALREDFPS